MGCEPPQGAVTAILPGAMPTRDDIKEQIKGLILAGELKEGDALPSMRLLAKELRISIITTKRAYEELEREGYIESYTGKGSFVKGINHEVVREGVFYEIEELFETAVGKARLAKLSYEEIKKVLDQINE